MRILLVTMTLGALASCAPVEPATPLEGSGKADGFGAPDASCYADTAPAFALDAPTGGETRTDAAVRALTRYAQCLLAHQEARLARTFDARGVDSEPIADAYRIQVAGGSCFGKDGFGRDLERDADVQSMVAQVRYAVEFLASFHETMNGYPNRYFDTVTLCPAGIVGGELVLTPNELYLGVSMPGGWILPRNAFALREHWQRGDHLDPHYEFLAPLWQHLDPIGGTRAFLRDAVADAALYLAGRLRAARGTPDASLRAELRSLVRDFVIPEYTGAASLRDGATLRDRALAIIENADPATLRRLAELWQDYVEAPDRWEGMADAVLATHEATLDSRYDLSLVQIGLVAVGNFHDISVAVKALLPRGREMARYVTVRPSRHELRVVQIAVVAVYTIDDVDVELAIAADMGVETAGLEHALERL